MYNSCVSHHRVLSCVINSICAGVTSNYTIIIGRTIPSTHTMRLNDVRSLLIIYSNYYLWMLNLVLSFCIISWFFPSVVRVFPGMSSTTNHVMSCFSVFPRYVILANLLQCMCPHFVGFSLLFIMFLCIFGHFLIFLPCKTCYVHSCEFWFSNSSV